MANQLSELDLALSVADDLPLPWTAWRGTPLTTRDGADPQAHAGVDVLATLGSKAVQAQLNRKPNGLMADTALRTMCGAGNQHFLGFNGLDRQSVAGMGVAEVYRSTRLTLGKYRNFSQAMPVAGA